MQDQFIQPTNFFQNASSRIFQQIKQAEIIERANQVYTEKTYLERNKNLYTTAKIASYLFQGTSALFAFTFGQHLVSSALPPLGEVFVMFTSCLLASLLLIGVEIFKRLCFGSFVVTLIQSRASSFSWAALLVNILLISVAVFTSTQGAKNFTHRQSDRSEMIRARYAVVADSTVKTFQKQMETANTELTDFKQAVSWDGKINMAEKNTASVIGSLNQHLDKLHDEKVKALTSLESNLQSDLRDNAMKTTKDSSSIFWISLMVELAGLLCIGYVYFFLSRVFMEYRILGDTKPENKLAVAPVGIQQQEDKAPENEQMEPGMPPVPNQFSADLTGFLQKYENVVKGLEEGLSNKQCAKRCKVSQTTVHNVKRCLRNLLNE